MNEVNDYNITCSRCDSPIKMINNSIIPCDNCFKDEKPPRNVDAVNKHKFYCPKDYHLTLSQTQQCKAVLHD